MYDPEKIRQHYDELGLGEWNRLDSSAHARLVYYLHNQFLKDHIGPGKKVLDAGCGSGKFSVDIIQSGSDLTLLDISKKQLAIANEKLNDLGYSIESSRFVEGNICDLSHFQTDSFDTTVCFGGALNYLFSKVDQAINELMRVTKKGGTLLISVMNRWGVIRYNLGRDTMDPDLFFGRPDYWMIHQVVETGDLPEHPEVKHPPRHFFTSNELLSILNRFQLTEIVLGTAPSFSAAFYNKLDLAERNLKTWEVIKNLEKKIYCQSGMLDSGEHLMAKGIVNK